MNFGRLGRVFGRLGASIKAGTGGGGSPPAATPTYHIYFF